MTHPPLSCILTHTHLLFCLLFLPLNICCKHFLMCLQNCYFKGYIAFLCVDVVIRALNCKRQKPSLNKNRDLMAYVTGVDMSGRDVRIQDSNYVFRNVPAECVSSPLGSACVLALLDFAAASRNFPMWLAMWSCIFPILDNRSKRMSS